MNENLKTPAFDVSLGKNNVISLKIKRFFCEAEESIKQAEFVKEAVEGIMEQKPKDKFKLLADIVATEEAQNFYLKERLIYLSLVSNPQLEKIALITNYVFYDKLGSIFGIITRRKNIIRPFKNKKEAISWFTKNE